MSDIETPWLIHRGKYRTNMGDIGNRFDWDYMGSSEFEFGTFPRSYQAMRLFEEQDECGLREDTIVVDGHEVFYLGPDARYDEAAQTVREELSGALGLRKEGTGMKAALTGEGYDYGGTDTWFAVDMNLPSCATTPPCEDHVPFVLSKHPDAIPSFVARIRGAK